MGILRDVEELYRGYIEEAEKAERKRKPTDGLFGIGPRPGDAPCHERFAEDLEKLLDEFRPEAAEPGEAAETLKYMTRMTREHREPASIYWMLLAVHGLAQKLVPALTREEASELASAYAKEYPRWNRLPVQKQLLKSLTEASR